MNQSYFSADRPLGNPSDDKLGRDRFSAAIADSIANWSSRESLTLSLTGEWGSGKSTIKNFIKHYLGDRAYILEFNAWQWTGQDKLVEAFLWQLGALFGKADIAKQAAKLASSWNAYASILKVGGVLALPIQTLAAKLFPFLTFGLVLSGLFRAPLWLMLILGLTCIAFSLSFFAKVTEGVATAFTAWGAARQPSLEELRAEIERELEKLDKPVVVFIDDIDRLNDAEIKLLIQLVKANAQFPNLVFFLLFQKSIVTAALDKITSDDGAKYLNKIVQVELTVPAASEKELQGMLTTSLDRIISRDEIKIRWDKQRWPFLFLDTLWPYFRNLRDVKRFLGVFEFYFGMHLNRDTLEVNPIDLIAIEVLRMFDHESFLAVSRAFFRGRDQLTRSVFGKDELKERFKADVEAVITGSKRNEDKQRLKTLLQNLFPQSISSSSENEWKRDFRVCDESSFDKYFEVRTDPSKPSAYDVRQFVESSNSREALVKLLRQSIANNTIEDFLDLIFVTREDVPLDRMEMVIAALFDVGDELPEARSSLFNAGLDMQVNRIIYHRLKGEDIGKTTDLLWNAFVNTTGFSQPISNLALEDKAVRERGEKTDFVIEEARLPDFTNLLLDRIRSRAKDYTLLEREDCDVVLFRWKQWSTREEVRQWIDDVVQEPARAVRLLQHLVSVSVVNGVKRIPYIDGEVVEEFVDLAKLYDAVGRLEVALRAETDTTNIALLEKAIELKTEGKPYSDVRAYVSDFQ